MWVLCAHACAHIELPFAKHFEFLPSVTTIISCNSWNNLLKLTKAAWCNEKSINSLLIWILSLLLDSCVTSWPQFPQPSNEDNHVQQHKVCWEHEKVLWTQGLAQNMVQAGNCLALDYFLYRNWSPLSVSPFFSLCLLLKIYLYIWKSELQIEMKRQRPSIFWFTFHMMQGLGQTKTRNQELHRNLPHRYRKPNSWVILCCFS